MGIMVEWVSVSLSFWNLYCVGSIDCRLWSCCGLALFICVSHSPSRACSPGPCCELATCLRYVFPLGGEFERVVVSSCSKFSHANAST